MANEKVLAAGENWVVSESAAFSSLTIGEGCTITAPENQRVILTVDGVQKDLDPGIYTGDVRLSVIDGVLVDYENHGHVDHYCMANAVVLENGKYMANKSVSAAVNAEAEITDTSVKNLKVVSQGDNFGGIMITGGEAVIEDVEMDLTGNGGCDFTGEGVGITAAGDAKVTVNRAKIHTLGSIRATVIGREDAEVVVNDSELFTRDGTKPNNVAGMTKVPWMLGLTGRVRSTNLVDNAHVTYNNCHVRCENWGTFSTDATKKDARLTLNNCLIESEKCGYGAYSIGDCLDLFSGCTVNMGSYPLIMCAEGSGTFTDGCVVNSGKVGVMMHGGQGTGTLTINGGSVFNTERAVLQVKGQGAYINVDNAQLNSKIGVILERFPNDDPNMSGKGDHGGPGGPGGPGGGSGGPGGPGGAPGGPGGPGGGPGGPGGAPGGMPDMGPSHNEVEASFSNCMLNGDFIDSMSEKGDFILNFKNTSITGAISTGTVYHPQGMPEESKWWLIGIVEHTLAPNDEETGIQVTLDASSSWTVTKNSAVNSLTIAEGAVVAAPEGKTLTVTNNGEAVELKPGRYEGKLILTVA